jgi:hypothetical protein
VCVLYGGLRISKLQLSIQRIYKKKFYSCKFLIIFGHQNPGLGTGSVSGSALNQCGCTTLLPPVEVMAASLQRAGQLLHGARAVAQGLGLLVRGESDARNATRKFLNLKCFLILMLFLIVCPYRNTKAIIFLKLNALSPVTFNLESKYLPAVVTQLHDIFFLNHPITYLAGSTNAHCTRPHFLPHPNMLCSPTFL